MTGEIVIFCGVLFSYILTNRLRRDVWIILPWIFMIRVNIGVIARDSRKQWKALSLACQFQRTTGDGITTIILWCKPPTKTPFKTSTLVLNKLVQRLNVSFGTQIGFDWCIFGVFFGIAKCLPRQARFRTGSFNSLLDLVSSYEECVVIAPSKTDSRSYPYFVCTCSICTRAAPKVMSPIYFHGNYNRYKEHNNTIW